MRRRIPGLWRHVELGQGGLEDPGPLGPVHRKVGALADRTWSQQRCQESGHRGHTPCRVAVDLGPGLLLPETVSGVDGPGSVLDLAFATGTARPRPGRAAVGPSAAAAAASLGG